MSVVTHIVTEVFAYNTRSQRPEELQLGAPEPTPTADILVVDVVGLFHPETADVIDIAVWRDTDLETATRRGMARDMALGRRYVNLWQDVWAPNERDFDARFAPRRHADVLIPDAQ